jgi:hypothetical protein
MLRASANRAPTLGGTMSEPAFWFAKSDDDVGSQARLREQQSPNKKRNEKHQ